MIEFSFFFLTKKWWEERKKNSTIELFNQAIFITLQRWSLQVHFIPTRYKEGSANILKYQLVFNGTGQSFEIFAAFVSRIKGRYRFIQSFLICTGYAHTSRETIPFLINETRVKASVQLNGSLLRPTPLNFIPGPKYEGKIDTFCPVFTVVFTISTSLPISVSRCGRNQVASLENNSRQLLRLLSRLSRPLQRVEKRGGTRPRYKIYNNDRINVSRRSVFDVYGLPIRSIISFSRIVESVHWYPILIFRVC